MKAKSDALKERKNFQKSMKKMRAKNTKRHGEHLYDADCLKCNP